MSVSLKACFKKGFDESHGGDEKIKYTEIMSQICMPQKSLQHNGALKFERSKFGRYAIVLRTLRFMFFGHKLSLNYLKLVNIHLLKH